MRIFCVLQGICLIIFLWSISIAVVYQEKLFPTLFAVIASVEILITVSGALLINIDCELASE